MNQREERRGGNNHSMPTESCPGAARITPAAIAKVKSKNEIRGSGKRSEMNYVCPHCQSENIRTIARYTTFEGEEEINWCIDCGTIDRMFKTKDEKGFIRQGFQVPGAYESTEKKAVAG